MTSTIFLYYKSLINKDKNFILDDGNGNRTIETYLGTLESSVIDNFQYIKQSLSLSIKIDMSQTKLMMGSNSKDLNYVKIQNGNENPCYYFIINKNWRSQNTIELVLSMDTLNTFTFNDDYEINAKTLVKREHKNRFGAKYLDTAMIPPRTCVRNIIDLKSEEISAPLYRDGLYDYILYELDGKSTIDWALYYKNSSNQENAPIDCYLVPSEAVSLYYQQASGAITTSNVPNDKYLLFFNTYNSPEITFDVDGSTYKPSYEYVSAGGYSTTAYTVIAIFNDNGTLKVYQARMTYTSNGVGYYGSWALISTHPQTLNVINSPASVKAYQVDSLPTSQQIFVNSYWLPTYATTTISMGALVQSTLYGNNKIDKTLEANVKIINVPYSPTPFSVDGNGIYTFASCWNYNSTDGKLKLEDFNTRFENEIDTGDKDLYFKYLKTNVANWNFSGSAKRFVKDPKLYHSDFFRPKFVYDSFTKVFPLEQMYAHSINFPNEKMNRNMKFKFVMSRNIVSKFLFQFDYDYDNTNEDYPNVLCVSRNNEEVLYNSQYLNYIRTGYNYDLKAKERQEVTAGVGIGLNALSLVASAIIGAGTGNPIAIGTAVASGISLVGQIVNYAKTTSQNEENIQRKIQETQAQSISVANADDYDLLYAYSHNKAMMTTYKVSTQMSNILDDLFYYGGYVCNEQKIPNVATRYWFNFLQASLVFEDTNNLNQEIEDDIREKFEMGVTFMHYHQGKFDLIQEMENFETYLIVEPEEE